MKTLLFALFLLLASPALAQQSIDDFVSPCSVVGDLPLAAGSEATNRGIGGGEVLCYEFDSGHGVAASQRLFVRPTAAASICLDPDRRSSGATGAAVVDVQWCGPDGATANACLDTGLVLTGANSCEAVQWGSYRFNVTTAPTGTEDAVIVIRGY